MEKIINIQIIKQLMRNYFNTAANKLEFNDFIEKNLVIICGIIKSLPKFSHTVMGERFYSLMISIPRFSGVEDVLPVTISERMLDLSSLCINQIISLQGQFRSYNYIDEANKSRLMLSVFAKDAAIIEPNDFIRYENQIMIDGYIGKTPAYRLTPFGKEITDIMLAVNRSYNKSDYIPVILWGRNARYSSYLPVGERMVLMGRLQSRTYEKTLESDETVVRTAYEVSVFNMAVIDKANSELEQQELSSSVA